MNKEIKIPYKGIEYSLRFTRGSVRMLEERGFNIHEMDKMPATRIPELFAGAFIANHRCVRKEIINEIYDKLNDKVELLSMLMELYNEPLEVLLADVDESEEGKLVWEKNW